ncbi:50S ribosomal protein L29 [Candidatus Gracilibacteria bacterium]|nr:50S ribosomal protein L29 [Candidatus Gracilibacteria bacterium]
MTWRRRAVKASEVRNMDNEQLKAQLNDYYKELFNLRFQKATGRLTNTARYGQVRKDIARIKTIMRERELQG